MKPRWHARSSGLETNAATRNGHMTRKGPLLAKKTSSARPAATGTKPVIKPAKPARRKRGAGAPRHPRVAVMVLGMHHSGTSALAGVLARVGCDLPETLVPPGVPAESGFFESNPVLELNRALLRSAGTDWNDWQPFPDRWMQSHHVADFKGRALATLEAEFGASLLFVMKDTQLGRLFPFWREALEAAGVSPVVVHVHRNPLEVAASLEAHRKLPRATGLLIWLRYMLDAEATTRDVPRSFTTYARLLESWQREVRKFETELDIVLPRQTVIVAREIERFLDPSLRHHASTPGAVMDNPQVAHWVRDLFEIFTRWSETGENRADHAALDAINAGFSAVAPIFGSLQTDTIRVPVDPDTVKELKKKLQQAHTALGALEATQTELDEAKGALGTAQAEAAESRATLQGMQERLDEATGALESTRAELAQARSALAQRQHETEEKTARIAELESQVDAMDEIVAAQVRELTATLEKRLAEKTGEAEASRGLRAELDARYRELAQLARQITSQDEAHREAMQALQDRLTQSTKDRENEIAALGAARAGLEAELQALRASKSWRVTGPLRRLSRLVQRG